VGPRTVMDAVVKRRIPSPRRESNLRTLIVMLTEFSCRRWRHEVRLYPHG